MEDDTMKQINRLAFENGRMRFLIGEAIERMISAERFLESREKMCSEVLRQWGDLIDRLQEVIEDRASL